MDNFNTYSPELGLEQPLTTTPMMPDWQMSQGQLPGRPDIQIFEPTEESQTKEGFNKIADAYNAFNPYDDQMEFNGDPTQDELFDKVIHPANTTEMAIVPYVEPASSIVPYTPPVEQAVEAAPEAEVSPAAEVVSETEAAPTLEVVTPVTELSEPAPEIILEAGSVDALLAQTEVAELSDTETLQLENIAMTIQEHRQETSNPLPYAEALQEYPESGFGFSERAVLSFAEIGNTTETEANTTSKIDSTTVAMVNLLVGQTNPEFSADTDTHLDFSLETGSILDLISQPDLAPAIVEQAEQLREISTGMRTSLELVEQTDVDLDLEELSATAELLDSWVEIALDYSILPARVQVELTESLEKPETAEKIQAMSKTTARPKLKEILAIAEVSPLTVPEEQAMNEAKDRIEIDQLEVLFDSVYRISPDATYEQRLELNSVYEMMLEMMKKVETTEEFVAMYQFLVKYVKSRVDKLPNDFALAMVWGDEIFPIMRGKNSFVVYDQIDNPYERVVLESGEGITTRNDFLGEDLPSVFSRFSAVSTDDEHPMKAESLAELDLDHRFDENLQQKVPIPLGVATMLTLEGVDGEPIKGDFTVIGVPQTNVHRKLSLPQTYSGVSEAA